MKEYFSQSDESVGNIGNINITLSMLADDDVFYSDENNKVRSLMDTGNQAVPDMESLNTPTSFDSKLLGSEFDFKEELSPVHNCTGKAKCSLVSPLLQTPTLVDGLFKMLTKPVFQFPEVAGKTPGCVENMQSEGHCFSPISESMETLSRSLCSLPTEERFQEIAEDEVTRLQRGSVSRSVTDLSAICCRTFSPTSLFFPPGTPIGLDLPQTPKTPTNGSEMEQFINWQRRPQEEDALSHSSLAESTNSLSSSLAESTNSLSLSLGSLYSQDEDFQDDLKNNNIQQSESYLETDIETINSSQESLHSNHSDHKMKRRFQNVCMAVNTKRRKIQKKLRRLTEDLSRCEIKKTTNEVNPECQDLETDIAYRNKMERERRSKMNDKFDTLRESIPDMEQMKKASKVSVLNRARTFIIELQQEDEILSSQMFIEKEKNKQLLERLVKLTQNM